MNWLRDIPFTLSISFHGGARVVNYPFDGNAENLIEYSSAPDDDVFKFLAQTYAGHNPLLYYKASCEDTKDFLHGITNGASWYPVIGGMQDYNFCRNSKIFHRRLNFSVRSFNKCFRTFRGFTSKGLRPVCTVLFDAFCKLTQGLSYCACICTLCRISQRLSFSISRRMSFFACICTLCRISKGVAKDCEYGPKRKNRRIFYMRTLIINS